MSLGLGYVKTQICTLCFHQPLPEYMRHFMNCLIPNFCVTWQHVSFQTGRTFFVRTSSLIHSLLYYPTVFCEFCDFFHLLTSFLTSYFHGLHLICSVFNDCIITLEVHRECRAKCIITSLVGISRNAASKE